MSRQPKLKLVANGSDSNGHGPANAPEKARDPQHLAPLDWLAVGLLCAALLLVAFWGGTFATPPRNFFAYAVQSGSPLALLDIVGIPLATIFVALAFFAVAWREWKRPVAVGAVPGLAGAAILTALFALLSLLRSPALFLSLNALAALLAALLLGGLASRLARNRNGFTALLLTLIVAGSLVAALGVREYLFKWKEGVPNYRVFATMTNPDFLAGYLLLTLPVTLAAFAASASRTARLCLGVGLALQSAALLLTGSRAGAAILLVTVGAWLAMALASRAAAGRGRRIGVGLAIFAVSALLASTPTLSRFVGTPASNAPQASGGGGGAVAAVSATAEQQSHSGSFRRWTWSGTIEMAKANPLLGTGLGTFDVTYPRYAETAYTAHAHNSFLQWAGETGILSALLLLTAFAAATAFAAHILLLPRRADWEEDEEEREEPAPKRAGLLSPQAAPETKPAIPADILAIERPRLLLAGLLAAIFGALLHNLIDSDWYIVAIGFTLCAVVGLLVGWARDIAPLAVQTPRPLSPLMAGAGLLLCAALLWRAGAVSAARMNSVSGLQAMMTGSGNPLEAYRAAAAADPFDPDPRLALAMLHQQLGESAQAKRYYEEAARIAPIGRAFYQLGQFLGKTGEPEGAIAALERARAAEPKNVQNLRLLGDMLRQAGKTERAIEVYRAMDVLEKSPYGTVRAMPDQIETEFAHAHLGLAEIAQAQGKPEESAAELGRAASVLHEFFARRNLESTVILKQERADKYNALLELYGKALTDWQRALAQLGAAGEKDRARAEAWLREYREGMEKDRQEKAAAEAQAGSSLAP